MLKPHFVLGVSAISLTVLVTVEASGQAYPSKPVRIYTQNPGGGNDFQARVIAPGLSDLLGQPVIVENRARSIAVEIVSKAAPDGYSLLLGGAGMWLAQFLESNVSWDPVRDFAPVTQTTSAPNVLVVHPSLPVKSVKELIALAKSKPGALNYASGTGGGSPHLAGELFKSMAKLNIVAIPYQGTGPSLIALLSGEVQLMFPTATAVIPHVKAGRLKALAVTGSRPSVLYPNLPTVAASGVPDYVTEVTIGISAPAKTPAAIVTRLNQEIVRAINRPELKDKLLGVGSEVVGGTPEQFAAVIKYEMTSLGNLITKLGIKN